MPKVSLNPDLARQGGGIEKGNYEVITSCFKVLKSENRDAILALVLDLHILDKDGEKVRDAEPVTANFSLGSKSLEHFSPGDGKSPDDTDPKDLGREPETEGNTVYTDYPGETFNKNSPIMIFFETLSKHGFPKSIFDRSWAPDLVGLKFGLDTVLPDQANKAFGMRLNTRPLKNAQTGEDIIITYKVATSWLNPEYLKGGTKKAESKSEPATSQSTSDNSDVNSILTEVLTEMAKKKPGEANAIGNKQKLIALFTSQYTTMKKPSKLLSACQAILRDDAKIADVLAEVGAIYEDGKTTFPDA